MLLEFCLRSRVTGCGRVLPIDSLFGLCRFGLAVPRGVTMLTPSHPTRLHVGEFKQGRVSFDHAPQRDEHRLFLLESIPG